MKCLIARPTQLISMSLSPIRQQEIRLPSFSTNLKPNIDDEITPHWIIVSVALFIDLLFVLELLVDAAFARSLSSLPPLSRPIRKIIGTPLNILITCWVQKWHGLGRERAVNRRAKLGLLHSVQRVTSIALVIGGGRRSRQSLKYRYRTAVEGVLVRELVVSLHSSPSEGVVMFRDCRTFRIDCCGIWFACLLFSSTLYAAQTTVNSGSPSVTDILNTIYTNGETFTRVEDYVNGGSADDEGTVNPLNPIGGLSGKTDQSWSGGVINATAKARFAGFNHSFGWERGGTDHILFTVSGSNYAVTGGVTNVDLSGGAFHFIDDTGFNVWSSDVSVNTDDKDHMVAYLVTGGATTGPTWILFFDDENGGGDRDFNDMVVEVTLAVTNSLCEPSVTNLTTDDQPSGCHTSIRPETTTGDDAPFVVTARTQIDKNSPTNPNASGSTGKVYVTGDGMGVKKSDCSGNSPINGSGNEQEQELIFTFDSPVLADSIIVTLNQLSFGSDQPVIFLSSTSSSGYDYTILEAEIQAASTNIGGSRYEVEFADFTSTTSNLLIDAFKVREITDAIYVKYVELLLPCDDGNPCTTDTCNSGVCAHTSVSNGTACSDGLFCNGVETCQSGVCGDRPDPCVDLAHCSESTDTCLQCKNDSECNDNNVCTSDKCDKGVCEHTNNNNSCSDGNQCTINDACSGGACVAGPPRTCSDANPCTTDSCNPATGCVFTNNTSSCNDGNACTTSDTCAGGSCVGGAAPNCNDSNSCTNDSCHVTKGCQHVNNTNSCNDGNACTSGDACSGGSCVGGPAITCNDNNPCTNNSCNPATGCVYTNNTASCNDGNACTKNEVCSGGTCQGGTATNCNDNNACTTDSCNPATGCTHVSITCNDNNPCTTDTCNPATGCVFTNNSLPCNDGSACTSNDTCSGGSCGGTAVVCNDNNPCTDNSCNPATGCVYTNNTASCSDSNACTTNDTCSGGVCVGGAAPNCNDNNVCTNDSCNPATGCVNTNNTNSCSDGNACTTNDTCSGGSCLGGAPPNCNDANDCTTDACNPATGCTNTNKPSGTACGSSLDTNCNNPDTCNGSGVCQGNLEPNGTSCSDGVFCNGAETCQGGTCASGTPVPNCCKTNAECSDGNVCNGAETCNLATHTCVAGTPLSCGDSNVCTNDSCHPVNGCQYANNTSSCTDGNACTTNDTCSGGSCVGGAPPNCNDGNVCTTDSCNNMTGCVNSNNNNPCSDGNACTTNDTCSGGSCAGGPAPDCNDGNVCTTDTCDTSLGCLHANNNSPCSDGSACTTSDTCSGGSCVGGPAPNCDDMNQCTNDSCSPMVGCVNTNSSNGTACGDSGMGACDDPDTCDGFGNCVNNHDADGTSCSDGIYCNGAEICVDGECEPGTPPTPCCETSADCDDHNVCTGVETCVNHVCVLGTPLSCGDSNVCTTDSCDPINGCMNSNNTDPCDDNNACTANDQCSGGVCGGGPVVCSDGNPCTTDSCNMVTGCVYTNNTLPCNDGNACTTNDTCGGGTCNGGAAPNCNDNNVCTNDTCSPMTGCVHSDNTLPCDDGDACTTSDTCAGGSCVGGPAPDCDDSNECTNDACNSMAGCVHTNKPSGTTCGDSADTNCDNPDTCNGLGSCQANHESNGTSCGDGIFCNGAETCVGGECTAGTPVPNCCDTNAECNDGDVCDGVETCNLGTHTCVPGTMLDCDDDEVCTTDSCHPITGCQYVDNSDPCDDENECTTNDTCSNGSCAGGPPPNCDDGNVCTTDSCNVATGCVNTNNTQPCSDNNACTTNDTCSGGSCVGGPAPNCNDGNVCTTDTCDPFLGCVNANNTNPCTDGSACTLNDTCQGGTCVGGPPPNCDDGNICTTDGCHPVLGCKHDNNTMQCDDGNACTDHHDRCEDGACVGGPAVNCDDGNVCTTDTCDTLLGCQHSDNTSTCDDGNACTTNDTCAGGSCVGGPAPNCDDGNVCTTDVCDNVLGCLHVNNTNSCNDGNACTTNDTCGGGSCHGGAPPVCNDGNVCTTDTCSPMVGCVYTNNSVPCNDGNACTTSDTCAGGSCVGGSAPNCDDGNVCTNDECHPNLGCVWIDNTDPCSDGSECTTNDTCSGGVCHGGAPLICNDNNQCTIDTCNAIVGCVFTNTPSGSPCGDASEAVCDHADSCDGMGNCADHQEPDNTSCSDGVLCNGAEICIGGLCQQGTPIAGCCKVDAECDNNNVCDGEETCQNNVCVPGTPLVCNDGNGCTNDSCHPTLGCAYVSNTDPCNDGNACTVNDICGGGMCLGGAPLDCNDGNVCTTDACNPGSGCVYTNNTNSCDDGNACTTADVCGGGTCNGGPAPNCNDNNGCTDDFCHPMFGCQHTNNVDPCSDGNACTTGDVCSGSMCQGGPPPNCNDGNVCTTDSCDMVLGCQNVNNMNSCDDGSACTLSDVCVAGVCTGGPAPNCDDGNGCTDDGCHPGSGCFHNNNTDPCSDGNACTTMDVCGGGTCNGGPAPNCNDGNVCTTDTCNMILGCIYTDNTLPCNDGNACTTSDTCGGGICNGGPAPDCDDMNECTFDFCDSLTGCGHTNTPINTPCGDLSNTICDNPDICDGNGACVSNHETNGASCTDGLVCNGAETCLGGICSPGSPPAGCCKTDEECDDGNVCNGEEQCIGNACVLAAVLECDDSNPCTTDNCDPTLGCQFVNNTLPCDDGNACTVSDVCGGGSCNGGGPLDCNDGNVCTNDSCSPMTGCQYTNNTFACDDGNACTTMDVCGGGSCHGGPAPICNDGNLCTDDACDPQSGCVYVNNSDPCDDGDECTTNDTCGGGSCNGGAPLDCDDGNVCTTDSCDMVQGCVYVNNSNPCSDGSACTTNDTCSGGVCVGGPAPNCDDLNPCTNDACDPGMGCQHVNNSSPCNDGNACTTNDTCGGGSCNGGPAPNCGDNNVCTTDSCDPITGCQHVNNSVSCDDGNACTVNETCSNGVCVGTVPLNCGDNNSCTNDSCNPLTGCVFVNNTDPCNDGSICTTGDVCVGGSCVGGSTMVCNDSNNCTTDSCHPTLGCQHNFNTSPCDDGQFCTTNDQCAGGVCVGRSAATACPGQLCDETANLCFDCNNSGDCDDGNACTTDTCTGQRSCDHTAISCTVNGDCPANAQCVNGHCSCELGVCLVAEDGPLPVDNCYSNDDTVVVNVILSNAQSPIVGGQFYMGYDPSCLDFISIEPGSVFDPGSPFEVEVMESVDEVTGTIFYGVHVALGGLGQNGGDAGTVGPAIMATITFQVTCDCAVQGVCFLPDDNPLHNYLVNRDGDKVIPPDLTCCTGDFNVNGSPPEVNCPDDIVTNADCDAVTADVHFDPITATDNCDGNLPFVPACSATYWASGQIGVGPSLNITSMVLPTGGEFPPGVTQIVCTATNSCGVSTTCDFTVTVSDDNTLEVIVQLSPTMDLGPFHRCIEFQLFSNCVEEPLEDGVFLVFGPPYNFVGHGDTVTAKIPAGQYACITARDPLHTLRSVADIECIDDHFFAEFKGDPVFGGNWLIGGNLDGSHIIDILDFGVLISQYLKPLDPNTLCGDSGPHADINADGIVDILDFSFIVSNFLSEDKDSCCPDGGVAGGGPAGITEITVEELRRIGKGELAIGDLNGDGVLNVDDMAVFMQSGGGAVPTSAPREPSTPVSDRTPRLEGNRVGQR